MVPSDVAPKGRTFPPSSRVKKRSRFLEVQRGRKIHTQHFVVTALRRPNTGPDPLEVRLGITVTKKVANAVGRNRLKRMVREVFRCNRPWFPPSSDVVVIAKDGAPALLLSRVEAELKDATERLRRAMR